MIRSETRAAINVKPIAILGYGTAGRGVWELAERMDVESTRFDETEIEGTRQQFSIGDACQHSVAVVSPGFKETHPWLKIARAAGLEVISDLDFAALFLTQSVYAVTGTNGKTVTSLFLTHTLNRARHSAVCVGNNGVSLCAWLAENIDAEPETRVVVEISSFQAARLKHLPIDGLIWTTFSENHLDYHHEMETYFGAKWGLIDRLVSPLFVMGQSVFEYTRSNNRELPEYATVVPNTPSAPDDTLPDGTIFDHAPFDEDFRLCVAFGEAIGIPKVIWHQTAQSFQLPRYRMTRVAEVHGIEFYNDAKSGNYASTLAGFSRFDKPVLWIGASPHVSTKSASDAVTQNGDLLGFTKAMAPKLKAAYLTGEMGGVMASLLRRVGATASVCETLEDAVLMAFEESQKGDTIVFSPAFPPQSLHESFVQRGNFFEKIVLELQSKERQKTGAKDQARAQVDV